MNITVKNVRIKTRSVQNGEIMEAPTEHFVLRVTLTTGAVYAIDLTGAQFGWNETVIEWDVFADKHIVETLATDEFGAMRTDHCWCANMKDAIDWWTNMYLEKIVKEFERGMEELVSKFSHGSDRSVLPLLGLPERDYARAAGKFLTLANEMVQEAVEAAGPSWVEENVANACT